MDQLNLPQFQLQAPPSNISQDEMNQIEEIFSSVLVCKYLQTLLWNNIIDEANIPIQLFLEAPEIHKLKVAFMKGGISMLQTLLSISVNRFRREQDEAEARRQQNQLRNRNEPSEL